MRVGETIQRVLQKALMDGTWGARWEQKQSQDGLETQKFSYTLLKGCSLYVDEFFRFLKTIKTANCYMILHNKSHNLQHKWILGGDETSGRYWSQICSVTKPSILPLAKREKSKLYLFLFSKIVPDLGWKLHLSINLGFLEKTPKSIKSSKL